MLRNGIRCIHKQVRSAAVHCALTVGTGIISTAASKTSEAS